MLYASTKKFALEAYNSAVEKYNAMYEKVQGQCQRLYVERKNSLILLVQVENLINSIANSPKELQTKISEIETERTEFRSKEDYAEEALKTEIAAGAATAAGVAGGTAIAALAPSAAMWVATTFGTASTGAAISSLSGAVATKAALAWLGGGALSAGGLGVAGGKALLALAGPIGWGIAGVAATTSAVFVGRKNKKVSEEAMQQAKKVTVAGAALNEASAKIDDLTEKTKMLLHKLDVQFSDLRYMHNASYVSLSDSEQMQLGSMVNNAHSLAQMLNKTV